MASLKKKWNRHLNEREKGKRELFITFSFQQRTRQNKKLRKHGERLTVKTLLK